MNVTAPLNLQGANQLESTVPQHLVITVGEGLARCKDDRVPSVDADWVEVFHAADYHRVVSGVPHYFKLDFLVTGN